MESVRATEASAVPYWTPAAELVLAELDASAAPPARLLIPLGDVADHKISIVIPALNEELTISEFVAWCQEGLAKAHARGEILIVDSSTDSTAIDNTSLESPRHSVIQALKNQPGEHLVLLRYAREHNPNDEWVYNRADIDASRIVWAREMGPEQDRDFIKYFHNRKVWLLEPDQSPPKLSPYGTR